MPLKLQIVVVCCWIILWKDTSDISLSWNYVFDYSTSRCDGTFFKFGSWNREVNGDRKKFNVFMDEMRKDREEVRKDFQELIKDFQEFRKDFQDVLRRFPSSSTISSSPIILTDIGERISKEIGAKAWAEETAQELIEQIQGKTRYKVQMLSFEYAYSFEPDEELLHKMQEAAFESGIDFRGVQDILGVELRDCLLRLGYLMSA